MKSIGQKLLGLVFALGVIGLVFGAPAAWFFHAWSGAGFVIVWSLLLMIVGRFDRLTKLSLGATGLNVELQQKIEEATDTIERVRSLAATTSYALLTELMASEFFYGSPLTKRLSIRDRVIAELKSLKLGDDKLRDVQSGWLAHGAVLFSSKVRSTVEKDIKTAGRGADDVAEFVAEYNKELQPDTWTAPSPDAIRTFLEKRRLLSVAAVEWIEDYRHFLETGDLRRPEQFIEA